MRIGFGVQAPTRRSYYTVHGQKLGYVSQVNGKQYAQDSQGRTVARILRWKIPPSPGAHACGGSFVYPH